MIGAVCFKVTNEYEVRIYMVGTYEQIDWTNPSPCVLGENYTCYALKNEEAGNAIQIVTGLNGQHMLRLFETKRYILRLVYEENLDIEVPRFQNENNKFLKLEKDKDYITREGVFRYMWMNTELSDNHKEYIYENEKFPCTERLLLFRTALRLSSAHPETSPLHRQVFPDMLLL